MGRQASEGLIVPLRQANGLPRPGAWTGKGASGQRSAGGKHGGYSRSRFRVNATTADSGACAASPADGIHFPEPPPRLHLAARGLLGHAPGRRRWCGRDNRCGLRSGPGLPICVRFWTGPSPVPTGHRRCGGCTSRKDPGRRRLGRSGYQRWRTKFSSGRSSCCCNRSTSRTSSPARTGFGQGDRHTRPWETYSTS